MDLTSEYLVAPLVIMEIKNKRVTNYLTPNSNHYLDIISKFTKPIFNSAEELLTYGLNVLGEHGTSLFILDLKE